MLYLSTTEDAEEHGVSIEQDRKRPNLRVHRVLGGR
jgi:hypothetical protein